MRESALAGVFIVDPEPVEDERGLFARTFCAREFAGRGLEARIVQCSTSFNARRGTLRGMHYQSAPHGETKLVRCTAGAIHDVVVDLRPGSTTHRRWAATELSASNRRAVYVPEGVAHGFVTLEDASEVLYQMSAFHEPGAARGVRWDDPAFEIDWPMKPVVVSARDRAFSDYLAAPVAATEPSGHPAMTDDFDRRNRETIQRMSEDADLRARSLDWLTASWRYEYSYHFTWLGLPIIQFPADLIAMQEIVWRVKPDLIVETGVARGGSLVFYASLLELIGGGGRVVGVDIDIRAHNRRAIEAHPMMKRITLIEGSSTDPAIVDRVRAIAQGKERVMVLLDSNHTHDHVEDELRRYAPMVTKGSYLVVFDTIIADMPEDFFPDRPWTKRRNPKTAVAEFLRADKRFEVDREIEDKLLLTALPGGFLRRVE